MKKGRHRRYEEARKFKRSHEDNLHDMIETFNEDEFDKPEHAAWAEEFAGGGDKEAEDADEDEKNESD